MKTTYFGVHYHETPAPAHIVGVTYTASPLAPSGWLRATYEPVMFQPDMPPPVMFQETPPAAPQALWSSSGYSGYYSAAPALPVPDLAAWQAMAVGLMMLAVCLRRSFNKDGA